MLDLRFIRKNPEFVQDALNRRGMDLSIQEFLQLDEERRSVIQDVEELRRQRNQASEEVARLKKNGEDASEQIDQLSRVSDRIKELEAKKKDREERLREIRLAIPNIPQEDVPTGDSDEDNIEVRRWGELPSFGFEPKPHWELGPELGGLDFERAAKITGSRFAVYWSWAARLERALINFMLELQTQQNGYTEILPPFIVNSESMQGTGQLPKFEEDLFKLEDWDYYLIPTAEVPLINLHMNEVIPEDDLPLAYTAFTPCFRSEAGSYGKDTKGLIRQHQFNKVELVRFTRPEDSKEQLEILLGHAEAVLRELELPYRVVTLCTGDLGFSASKTYDVEIWLPGQNAFREISSCSNCGDFQARRAGIRYKPRDAKGSELLHTLNGSGMAVGRTLLAILENNQQEDGSVLIPKALRPYMGGMERIEPTTGAGRA
ncbi:MAG: serine--tRNA ligase [Desulfohalobiaceae bacterium]|nr:serine--tRNA ligase [Desulfohalobiaceae bacterium]